MTKGMLFYFLDWANLVVNEEACLLMTRYIRLVVHFNIDCPQSVVEQAALIKYVYNELFAIEQVN